MLTESEFQIQKNKDFTFRDSLFFIALTILSFFALTKFGLKWFAIGDWKNYPVVCSIITLMIAVYLINNAGKWFLLPFMKKPEEVMPEPGLRVAVLTTFVSGHESLVMLEQTLTAMVKLDYPHDTWVLDEEDDVAVKLLCSKIGVNHFSRKHLLQYQTKTGIYKFCSKYGNYNAWLHQTGFEKYDIITAFDPDHVPKANFLTRVLGYFRDPKIGYVQAAQAYYNQKSSFIARGAAEETYAYYSSIQMANYGLGYPIIVGSHNSHRVSALKKVGGFAPHDADDLLLTSYYRTHGWQGVYVPEILARGLTPVDWYGYINQQWRWARSVLDLKLRYFPKMYKKFSPGTRIINGLHGLSYLHRSMMIFILLGLLFFMTATGISPGVVSLEMLPEILILYISLQFCELFRQRFYLDWRRESGIHWRVAILDYAKWPYFLLALYDVIRDKQRPYFLTSKTNHNPNPNRLVILPNVIIIILIEAAMVVGFTQPQFINPVVYFLDTLVVICSLGLILTEYQQFPNPYERISDPALSSNYELKSSPKLAPDAGECPGVTIEVEN